MKYDQDIERFVRDIKVSSIRVIQGVLHTVSSLSGSLSQKAVL